MAGDLYQQKYRIESARLAEYDYGSNGMYFITICTRNRDIYFGDIAPDTASLRVSPIGQVAMDCWHTIPAFHPYVELDAFQVMPNHVHGVLWICKTEEQLTDWQPNRFGPQRQNLASIIRGYKSAVKTHATIHAIDFGWQPRYYDRVVRNQHELDRIRTYVENNPAKWAQEQNNPENLYM